MRHILGFFGGTTFVPVTHNRTGSGNETVPTGASQVVITAKGAGSGGNYLNAGAPGDETITTKSLNGADWGANLAYACGVGGLGKTTGSRNAGTSTTITGSLSSGAINIRAAGGLSGDGNTGYDTLINGGGGAGGDQGISGDGIPGGPGADGSISFAYT